MCFHVIYMVKDIWKKRIYWTRPARGAAPPLPAPPARPWCPGPARTPASCLSGRSAPAPPLLSALARGTGTPIAHGPTRTRAHAPSLHAPGYAPLLTRSSPVRSANAPRRAPPVRPSPRWSLPGGSSGQPHRLPQRRQPRSCAWNGRCRSCRGSRPRLHRTQQAGCSLRHGRLQPGLLHRVTAADAQGWREPTAPSASWPSKSAVLGSCPIETKAALTCRRAHWVRAQVVCMPCACRAECPCRVRYRVPWAWAAGSMHLEQRLSELQCAAAVGGRRLRAHARVRERTSGALEAGDGGVPQDADAAVREHAVGQP